MGQIRVSLKSKKKIINEFINLFDDATYGSYFNYSIIQYLSTQKIYKLLRLSLESYGKSYDKKLLKFFAKNLKDTDLRNLSKKGIKASFKLIRSYDIAELIDYKELEDIFEKFVIIYDYNATEESQDHVNKLFLKLGILRL